MIPNDAYLHLLLNHFPIIGAFLATLLLLYALVMGKDPVIRAALLMAVLVSLLAIPANKTGHGAAKIVKQMPLVERHMVGEHEDRAKKAALAIWITGGFAALGLLAAGRGEVPKWAAAGTLALLIASSGLMAWTARAGGQIHHAETRPGFIVPAVSTGSGGGGGHGQGNDDHSH
ncbi:MAG: hypothetical protein ACE5FC_04310 [Myxococcota bacterium]